MAASMTGALRPLDLLARDAVLRALPSYAAVGVAAVVVDEEAIRTVGPWPWSRPLLADLVARTRAAGAAGIAVDVLLLEDREGDAALAAALAAGPAALAAGIDDRGSWLLPAPGLRGAATVAHVSVEADGDGVLRRVAATKERDDRSFPALSVAAVRLADPDRPVPVGAVLRPGWRCRPGELPRLGADRVLRGDPAAAALKGRVVFIGATAAGIGDRAVTPVSPAGNPEPGVLVQAAVAEAFARRDLLRLVAPLGSGLVAALAAVLAMALSRRGLEGGRAVAVLAALLPLPVAAAALAGARLELPGVSCAAGPLAVTTGAILLAAARERRAAAAAARRVGELEALAASLEAGRRDEAEVRRVVAHELRTPLTSVRGLAQLLAGFDLSAEERKRVAGLVATEAARLSEMVEALLDLERLKLRPFADHAAPVALSDVVSARLSVLGEGSGRTLVSEVAPGLVVRGDAALLGRVVDNLVGNAFKFSPEAEPVTVRLARAGREAALEVEDRGPGIAAEERARVFRPFVRAGVASVPGLGLGLALVSEAATWHRGRVSVATAPSGGSLFRLVLPLAPAAGREA